MKDLQFNLDQDLVFFDIEATGLNVLRDRIIQIALIKYPKSGAPKEELVLLINPAMPIAPDAFAVHGISAEMVRNKPVFAQVADELFDFIGPADLSGYNLNRFDVPMLMEEFARVGKEFDISKRRIIDVQRIFYKMEPRTLSAAYKYYCNEKLEGAHDALIDVEATIDVLKGQIAMYRDRDYEDGDGNITKSPVRNDMSSLASFTNDSNTVDVTQRLKYDHNREIIFNFGKYSGQKVVDVLKKDKQYYHWILDKDFSSQVKQIIKKLMKEHVQD